MPQADSDKAFAFMRLRSAHECLLRLDRSTAAYVLALALNADISSGTCLPHSITLRDECGCTVRKTFFKYK